ncbi:MAG: tetratricopeptide repeat protein [Nitrospirota bacterium]
MFPRLTLRRSAVALACALLLAGGAGCAFSREARLAQEFGASGNWDGAVILYEQALKHSPDNPKLREGLDQARVKAAAMHYERGQALLKEQQIDAALEEFKRALTYDSGRPEHRAAFDDAVKARQAEVHMQSGRQLLKAGRLDEALQEFEAALEGNPALVDAQEAVMQITQRKRAAGSSGELALSSNEPITIKFQNARLKEVFELLAKSYGVNILFDRDVRDDPVTVFIKDASFREALNLILGTNNLFMKRINEKTILVVPKTKAKANQYEDLQIRTFYLSVTPAKEMVNLLRTMLDTRRVFVNNDLNAIVMRDNADKLELAAKIIAANDRQIAEVTFDVEIIEVARTKILKYGWQLQPSNSASANIGSEDGLTLSDLSSLTKSDIFVTLPTVVVDLIKQDSDAQTLANPRIRALNGSTAKINVGDKVPILLSTTTSTATTSTVTGGTTTSTSTEFKDVGIKLSIEPTIHLNNDVRMKINLEVTSLGEFVREANQFRFGNRTAETVLNVHDGETVVIGGLIRDEDRTALNKIPGLGDIPILGKLFSNTDKQKIKSDIILTITPRVVRKLEPPGDDLLAFWSGTEEAYATAPMFSGLSFGGSPSSAGEPGEFVAPPPMPEFPPSDAPPMEPPQEVPPPPPMPPSMRPPPPFPSGTYLPADGRPSGGVIRLAPEQPTISAQESIRVEVRADNVEKLSEALFSVAYDPNVLEFQRAVEGDFLGRENWPTTFSASADPESGQVELRLLRLSDVDGSRGSGVLCTLVFRGKGVGASPVTVKDGQFTNPDHAPVPVTSHRGVVVVR